MLPRPGGFPQLRLRGIRIVKNDSIYNGFCNFRSEMTVFIRFSATFVLDDIWNLKSEIWNLNWEIWNTWNLKCEIWNLKYGIRNRKPQIGSLKYEISNLESGIQNRKSEIWSCQRPCCKKGFNAARLAFSELIWQWWLNRAVLNNLTCEKYETWQESQNSD